MNQGGGAGPTEIGDVHYNTPEPQESQHSLQKQQCMIEMHCERGHADNLNTNCPTGWANVKGQN